jgi:hypothetical protein
VVIWLKANVPVPQSLVDDLKQIVKGVVGDQVTPLVVPLQMAPVIVDSDRAVMMKSEEEKLFQEH